jgi:hypothetical protein
VLASGYEGNVNDENFQQPYVLRWNGSAWSMKTVPNAGTEGSRLNAITALSGRDVWAFGETLEDDGAILTFAARFDGSRWVIQPVPDPGQQGPLVSNSLLAAASPGGRLVWALGGKQTPGECCQQTLAMETAKG